MILTTTHQIESKTIATYIDIVTGETIIGANIFKDLFAGIRDIIGGRSSSYEKTLREAKEQAIKEMTERAVKLGAEAIVGIDLHYQTVGKANGMLMVTCSGTAVKFA